jgi:tetratricopeptide (TPR) repeat protein
MKQILTVLLSLILIIVLSGFLLTESAEANTCEKWVAKIVSVQGNVQARAKDREQWTPVRINSTFCTGDMLRVQELSRAAIVMLNDTILRLDQNTTITFTGIEKREISLLDLITGAVHFISRVPRTLKVSTPFVNGTVEGTEFFVRVFDDHTFFTVFEGLVLASNQAGSLKLGSGQSAVAEEGKAPVMRVMVRPRDSVQWALYYPPVLYFQSAGIKGGTEGDWKIRKSIGYYLKGDLEKALSSIGEAQQGMRDKLYYNYRAALLLSVGRVDEARKDIEQALKLSPGNSSSIALQSIIALVQNEKEKAMDLADDAVQKDPDSVAALIALSYAKQAGFDLEGALMSLEKAVGLDPENSLAWARLSELRLSFADLDGALISAHKAVSLNPDLARTQTVLGYAYLMNLKVQTALETFEKAIMLDQADPLPRMGLGLAKIKKGRLKEGRRDIEIAVSLDPNYALSRSYLGKAYYEEKRDSLAVTQYGISKELDPMDPTPFFYDAIRKQSINRPVEALHDVQKSIELNENRAVYRSKLLLDEDLASRSSGLARIYGDLGFQQLALVEGWKSVNTDPGNYSAHRFLADSYAALPRHEIARVSELLRSQLLQPINITPVQPQLAESSLFILDGAGPGSLSFNEFNPLFNRNRFALQVSGVAGENSTYGDEVVVSGMYDGFSLSVGRFHYQTDGFRENNDQEHDIYNVFSQLSLTRKTSVQAEFRYKETDKGDLSLNFDPDAFFTDWRENERSHSLRLGLRHEAAPHSTIIVSLIYRNFEEDFDLFPVIGIESDESGYLAEAQYLFQSRPLKVIGGAGYFSSDLEEVTTTTLIIPPLPPMTEITKSDNDIDHTNVYVYSLVNYPKTMTWTVGGSGDFFQGILVDQNQFNPKFGVTWNPIPKTTLRAAVFRTLQRQLIADQTIEPTQVAGFNQFFDDLNAADAWLYGVAIDQKISSSLFGGVEYSERDIKLPFEDISFPPPPAPPIPLVTVQEADWEENILRAYLYWAPLSWLSASGEYRYEHLKRDEEFFGPEDIESIKTHKIPLKINLHFSSGFSFRVSTTYVEQEGVFLDPMFQTTAEDSDQFWVVDAAASYRLPKRWGIISVEGKNILDEDFKFQDTDPANPDIYPERLILGKITLAF